MPDIVALDLIGSGLSYPEIWDLQKYYVEEIGARRQPEMLLFCEHEEVVTAGRRARKENLLNSRYPVYEIERGGDFTLHQPGQLVIYPLTRVQERWKGLRGLLKGLENFTSQILTKRGLATCAGPATGVWIDAANPRKVASIGVAVRHWISYHGMALNISNDLSAFRVIRPCDFEASIMTSLKHEGVTAHFQDIRDDFIQAWEAHFGEKVTYANANLSLPAVFTKTGKPPMLTDAPDFLHANEEAYLQEFEERYSAK